MRRRWKDANWVGRLFTLQVIGNIVILWVFALAMYGVATRASHEAMLAGDRARLQSEQNERLIQANQAILQIVIENQAALSNVDRRLLKALRGLRIDCDESTLALKCVLKVPKLPAHIITVPIPVPSPSPSPCRPPQCKPTPSPTPPTN